MTYTFSRALHMMRYGKAKMKPIHYTNSYYALSSNGEVLEYIDIENNSIGIAELGSHELLCSWIEVKDKE